MRGISPLRAQPEVLELLNQPVPVPENRGTCPVLDAQVATALSNSDEFSDAPSALGRIFGKMEAAVKFRNLFELGWGDREVAGRVYALDAGIIDEPAEGGLLRLGYYPVR